MKKRGFTLIELIVAVGIMSVMAAVSVVSINPAKRIGQANDAQRDADLVTIGKAIELYAADNAELPSDFLSSNVGENHKVVLCSSAAELTCDGQTRDCLVIDDSDFLGAYLPILPIDPEKSTDTDTGYYVTRNEGDIVSFGSCDSYQESNIEIAAQIELPPYSATCGDGEVEGDEVCDDGDTFNEGCGNGTLEDVGVYCNSTCTANINITVKEVCDYDHWSPECFSPIIGTHTESSAGKDRWCKSNCIESAAFCPMEG